MKYGESTFGVLYLLFAIISGCALLYRAGDKSEKAAAEFAKKIPA